MTDYITGHVFSRLSKFDFEDGTDEEEGGSELVMNDANDSPSGVVSALV